MSHLLLRSCSVISRRIWFLDDPTLDKISSMGLSVYVLCAQPDDTGAWLLCDSVVDNEIFSQPIKCNVDIPTIFDLTHPRISCRWPLPAVSFTLTTVTAMQNHGMGPW